MFIHRLFFSHSDIVTPQSPDYNLNKSLFLMPISQYSPKATYHPKYLGIVANQ